MFKEAESRPDKIESTLNNVQVRKKQQHRRRACDLLASLKFQLNITAKISYENQFFVTTKGNIVRHIYLFFPKQI